MLVSVVIPFYKEIDLIGRAIESAANQRLPVGCAIEVIVGDDSSFGEQAILQAVPAGARHVVRIARNEGTKGAGGARNAALDAARGTVVAFLDSDDYWLPGKLSAQLSLLESGATFVAGTYRFEGMATLIRPPAALTSSYEVLCNTTIGTSTVVLSGELLGAYRFTDLQFSQDLELWARLASRPGFQFAACQDVCTVYAPSSRTRNKFRQFIYFRNVVRRFGLSPERRVVVYVRYAARGLYNHVWRRAMGRLRAGE